MDHVYEEKQNLYSIVLELEKARNVIQEAINKAHDYRFACGCSLLDRCDYHIDEEDK